ncbi:NADH dehydrogenase (ubiquinone) complex I, assembly factor 6 [Microplitis mediator]|uniref:NADH dehydrogenase (ubiquinone) complex I, assembly factor 6 n=1 Tax=Microplitis mediator TaxID=375433 RepID=UPI00255573A2|nr:NADH dehydrogenase (ubiquinone) complex I, assembly factor 6 [Microplitis mediator]
MNKTRLLTKITSDKLNRSVSTVKKQSPTKYCLQLVRKHDYENYLCSLLLPKNLQLPAIAIRALNVEISLVQEHSRELAISNMRYTFWNDTIAKIFDNKPPEAPVPLELSRILRTHKLSKRYFQRLLDARWSKSQSASFLDLAAIEKYSEDTVSSIYYLLLEVKDIKDVNVDHVASHVGKAQGIVNLLRSVPYHARRRNLVLPQDIMMQNNVSSESVFRGEASKDLNEVIFAVASRAHQHLDKAKNLRKSIKKNLDHIFLPAVIVERFLKRLQYADFNIYDKQLHTKENMLPFHLWWAKLFTEW